MARTVHARFVASEEELIATFLTGADDALDVLVDRYRPVVGALVDHHDPSGARRHRLVHEAMLGLWDAICAYRPEDGPFAPLALRCIRRHLLAATAAPPPSHGRLERFRVLLRD